MGSVISGRREWLFVTLGALWALGCGTTSGPDDAAAIDGGSDTAAIDGGSDASVPEDTGPGSDTGRDASVPVDGGAPGLFAFPTAVPGRSMPYYGTANLTVGDANATRAVLVVHGTNRNADDYFDRVVAAAELAGARADTVIIAPRFTIADDSPDPGTLFWTTNGGWKRGDRSSPTLSPRLSSFEVLDAMVLALGDRALFPRVTRIVVTGHSAGGQLVQRFALGAEADLAITDATVRYAPANPSSYAYLDAERSVGGSTSMFAVPPAACAAYDEWKYGLTDLNAHMTSIGAATARARYRSRDVVYLLGENDDDPAATDLDVGCEASEQGDSRFTRGEIFFGHVAQHYGAQPHRLVTVPDVGHSSSQMFRAASVRAVLFTPSAAIRVGAQLPK